MARALGDIRPYITRIAARLLGKAPAAPTAPHQPPALPPGDTPDEWRVGDQAECIAEGYWRCRKTGLLLEDGGPQFREVYRVTNVDCRIGFTALEFPRWPDSGFSAVAFRKITPRADEAKVGTCATIKSLLRLAPQTDEVA